VRNSLSIRAGVIQKQPKQSSGRSVQLRRVFELASRRDKSGRAENKNGAFKIIESLFTNHTLSTRKSTTVDEDERLRQQASDHELSHTRAA